jgi:TonB family protein
MIRHGAVLLLAFALARPGCAQTDPQGLEATLKDKQMVLRSYSADSVARYDWEQDQFVAKPVNIHGFGVFTTQSVTLTKGKLVLEGERATIVRNVQANQVFLAVKQPMRIEISLQGADPATSIPKIQEMIFFPDIQAAAAALPEWVSDLLPFDTSSTPQEKKPFVRVFDNDRWVHIDRDSTTIVPPKLTLSAAPELTSEATHARVKGFVTVAIYVSEKGHVDEVWLLKPLGFGLEEKAADAVRRYIFKPELSNGRSVGTSLIVNVDFQVL